MSSRPNSPPPKKRWRQSRLSFAAVTAADKPASYSDGAHSASSRFSHFNAVLPALDGNCMFSALSDQLSALCIADVSAYQLRHELCSTCDNVRKSC